MYNTIALEEKNRNRGRVISFVIHALLLLLAFIYYLPAAEMDLEDEKPPYAIKVDFTFKESSMSKLAHDDEGAQRAKSESAPAEEKPQETPKEEVTKPEEIEVTKPQVIDVPKPDIKLPTPVIIPRNDEVIITKAPAEEAPIKVSEPTRTSTSSPTKSSSSSVPSNTSGSTTGTSTSKPSTVDGKAGGTGKGNEGTGAGRDKGNDGDAGSGNASDGTGAYDGSGDGIFKRKIIYRDQSSIKKAVNVSGKIAVKVCINRGGMVTYLELLNSETTVRDKPTLKMYLQAAKTYKFQPDLSTNTPKEQCGKIKFNVDNSVNNKLR
jgi:outer membrane biosynthesis protein TonB